MNGDGYQASVDSLRQHGTNLARIMGQLDPALEAARSASVPEDAFGIVCRELGISGWLVAPLQERGVQAVTNAVAGADEFKKNIDASARDYDQHEIQHATQLANLNERL